MRQIVKECGEESLTMAREPIAEADVCFDKLHRLELREDVPLVVAQCAPGHFNSIGASELLVHD